MIMFTDDLNMKMRFVFNLYDYNKKGKICI